MNKQDNNKWYKYTTIRIGKLKALIEIGHWMKGRTLISWPHDCGLWYSVFAVLVPFGRIDIDWDTHGVLA